MSPDTMAIQLSAAEKNAKCIHAFEKYLATSGFAKATRAAYVNFVRRFSEFLGAQKSFAEVTLSDVTGFRIVLYERGVSPATQNLAFAALRKLYRVLQMADVVSWSPAHQLPRRKLPKRLKMHLTEKEVKKLLRADVPLRDVALMEFLYATGCRPSEVSKMTLADVGLGARTATVRDGKDGDRIVCFGRPAAKALQKYLNGRSTGLLFRSNLWPQRGSLLLVHGRRSAYWRAFWREWKELPDGTLKRVSRSAFLGSEIELPTPKDAQLALKVFLEKQRQSEEQQKLEAIACSGKLEKPISVRQILRIVKRAALVAGLGNRAFSYQLRHSFATHCLKHGMDLRYLQHLMGHAHAGITQVYLHQSPEELVNVHRRFFREPNPHAKAKDE